MCARSESVKQVQHAAEGLSQACFNATPRSYREHLNDTLTEEIPEAIKRLLDRLN